MTTYIVQPTNDNQKRHKSKKLARPIQPKRLVRPGQLEGNSERARGIFFSLLYLCFYIFSKYEAIVSIIGLSLGY